MHYKQTSTRIKHNLSTFVSALQK